MSEAAKPADPERALARLEALLLHAEADWRAERIPSPAAVTLCEAMGKEAQWLLPLARAGLRCQKGACAAADVAVPEHRVDALQQEFEACVRVLARLTEIDALSTDGVTYRLTASSVAAIALAQPLAAAVLRSQGGGDAKNAQQGVKREPAPPAAAQAGASANAEAQEAIAEGAVLRSPEPATPADGGA